LYKFLMNICNKPPNKTAPEKEGEATVEVQSQHTRRNGWSWPLHPFQIIAWLLYLFFALIGFGILVPLLPHHWVPAGYIVSFQLTINHVGVLLPISSSGFFPAWNKQRSAHNSSPCKLGCLTMLCCCNSHLGCSQTSLPAFK
uniref:Uncharacterized protein n=1 Tax=Chrysemys picta bellii TaxID=8478 RepID=A0A8C3IQT5_CHRPI